MRELVEAAVQAAARHGVVAVIVGGNNGNGNGAHAPVAPPAGADADTVARYQAATARIQALEAEMQRRDAGLVAITAERDKYGQALREAETAIRNLPAAPAVPGGTTAPAPGTLDGQSIDILGIEDEIAKKLKKKEWLTVGQLRAALLEGKLASEAKIPKDGIIAVSWALLGKTPSAVLPPGAPAAVAPAAVAPAAAGAASDVPAGHADRSWKERLQAARKKERDKKATEAKIAATTAQMNATTDPGAKASLAALIANDQGTLEVLGGQVYCLLWACGLISPGTFKSIKDVNADVALTSAGLLQFVETAPAPVGVPAASPAPAAPPAAPPAPQA